MKLKSHEKTIVEWPVHNVLQQNKNLLKHFTTSLHAFDSTISKKPLLCQRLGQRWPATGYQALDVNIKTKKPMLSFSSQTIVSFNFWNFWNCLQKNWLKLFNRRNCDVRIPSMSKLRWCFPMFYRVSQRR